MIGKAIVLLVIAAGILEYCNAQTCLTISGPCIAGTQCLNGDTCINGTCCTTNANQNCNNTLPDDFCNGNVDKCTDAALKDAMSRQCARACKTCSGSSSSGTGSGTGSGTTCTDSNSNCVNWVKNGFCTNSFYTADQRKQYCQKSCNLC